MGARRADAGWCEAEGRVRHLPRALPKRRSTLSSDRLRRRVLDGPAVAAVGGCPGGCAKDGGEDGGVHDSDSDDDEIVAGVVGDVISAGVTDDV